MKVHQTDFSKGNVYRNILEVSIPMTLAQLLNLLYNVVDRMYIGRIPGAGATALTGLRHLFNHRILTNRRNTAFFMSNFVFIFVVRCCICIK